jgi:hypothetical protein
MSLAMFWCFRTFQRRSFEQMPSQIIKLLLIGLLACTICGIQLVPTAEFLQHVRRGEFAVEKLQNQALNGHYLWTALTGGTLDNCEDTDSINAVGLGIIALALLALCQKRTRRQVLPYLLIAVFSWLLAIGPAFPFWAKLIPGLSRFHAPRRSLMLLSVMMPIAAGIGASLLHKLLRRTPRRRLVYFTTLGVALASGAWVLPRLERVFTDPGRLSPPTQRVHALAEQRYITLDPTMNYAYDSRRSDYGISLLPNAASLTGLLDAQGYDPLVPERLAMARDIACARSGIFWPSHGALFTDPMSPVLKLLAVQYLIGRYDLFDPSRVLPGRSIDPHAISLQVEMVDSDSKWPIHRFRDNRPLAWSVASVNRAGSPREALQRTIAGDPYLIAWTESATDIDGPLEPSKEVKTSTLNGGSLELSFSPSAGRFQFICVSQNWFPGWTAETGNRLKVQVLPANGTITGIVIPPAISKVTLSYNPPSFLRGLLITISGFLLCTALCVRKP